MATRKIIEIDRELCNGCGLCTTACDEGALALDDEGKAYLVRELYCDGMGMCLNVCPTDALQVVERESEAYDYEATVEHVARTRGEDAVALVHKDPEEEGASARSEITQWPIQLHLITPAAPYFRGADLLVAADCTAFALGSFHHDLLKDRKMVIACPKLDDVGPYTDKLASLIRDNHLNSLTVAIMTVPCCGGLRYLVDQAVAQSGVDIPVQTVVIGIDGQIAGEA